MLQSKNILELIDPSITLHDQGAPEHVGPGASCQSWFLILEGRRFGLGLAYIFTLLSSRSWDGLEEEEEWTS
jgi:hypothetical protein